MPTTNRGPWSLSRDEPHPRRGESPGSRSSPSNAAADSGHLVRSPGKGPAVRREQLQPSGRAGQAQMIDPGQRLQVVLVPVEVPAAGSPKTVHGVKPPAYPNNQREAWRPRTRPPSKAERLGRFIDDMHHNEQAARSMMKPDLSALKAAYGV